MRFASDAELLAFAKKYQSASGYYYYGNGGMMRDVAVPMMATGAAAESKVSAAPSAAPSPDFSATNIQVKGVDEADLLKTDGNYIYTVSNNMLYIIKAYPGKDAEVLSTIKFETEDSSSGSSSGSSIAAKVRCLACPPPGPTSYGYHPSDLFISGNKLAVFGSYSNAKFFADIGYTPRNGMSFFNVYDISDPKNPKLEKEYKFEGTYFRARMKGDYIYFVTASSPQYRDYPTPLIVTGASKYQLPVADIYYFNVPYNSPVFMNIHAVNLADTTKAVSSKSLVVESSQEMYMSEGSIYLTYTENVNEYELRNEITLALYRERIRLSPLDRVLVSGIESVDDSILSPYEKQSKIMGIYSSYLDAMGTKDRDKFYADVDSSLEKKLGGYKYFEFTVINKVGIDGGKITPSANGKVPGHISNQFSMDENKGIFRIATTLSPRWSSFGGESTKSTNNIYTLDSSLKVLGTKENIAENEQIYSTRFIGDRLYMVTFRQVDPFFVFDLSNPSNIKELGKLKIPGFSRYLHPYDENTIIGIGKDATDSGRTTGLKISLFDVSDVSNPKELAKYVTEERYADSSALTEHKAFLFSKEKNLLVIPVYSYGGGMWDEWGRKASSDENYNGAFVFRVDKSQVTLRGLIDHSMAAGDYYYQPAVQRSLYINDMLYTKSEKLLRVNALDTLTSVKNVWLNATSGGIPIY